MKKKSTVKEKLEDIEFGADEIQFDINRKILTLTSNSVLSSSLAQLSADLITYNHEKKTFLAKNNVRLRYHHIGALIESEEIKINDKFQIIYAKKIKIILSDNRTLYIDSIKYIGQDKHKLYNIRFLPCEQCDAGRKKHKWYIKTQTGVLDIKNGFVKIQDNTISIFDISIYGKENHTIHFSKKKNNKFDITMPKIVSLLAKKRLSLPFKMKISDNQHIEFLPYFSLPLLTQGANMTTTFNNPAVKLSYDKEFTNGHYNLSTFVARDSKRSMLGDARKNNVVLLHSNINFITTDKWNIGGIVNIASDYNALADYNVMSDTSIKHSIYAYKSDKRDYTSFTYTDFFDYEEFKRPTQLSMRPWFVFDHYFETKGKNDDLYLNIDLLNAVKNDSIDEEEDSLRLSAKLAYSSLHKSHGQVIKFGVSATSNTYFTSGLTNTQIYNEKNRVVSNITPNVYIDYGYPLISQDITDKSATTLRIEPKIIMKASHRIGSRSLFQPIDSTIPVLQSTNIFDTDVYSSYDIYNNGVELLYGLNIETFNKNFNKASFLIGRRYKLLGKDAFNLIGAQNGKSSDYILGMKLSMSYVGSFDGSLRFDKKDFSLNEIYAGYNTKIGKIDLSLSYVHLNDRISNIKYGEIITSSKYTLSDHMFMAMSTHYDYRRKFFKETSVSVNFKEESIEYGLLYERKKSNINSEYTSNYGIFFSLNKL